MISASFSPKRIQIIAWTLLSLMPIIGMAIDLIAPSLPAMAHSLNVTPAATKNAISIYILGYALGNFLTGFLTDAYGRKRIMHLSLFAFLLVSLVPIIFPNITALLISRILQGVALGSVAVVTRAILSDIFMPQQLIRFGPIIGAMWGLGPVFGPVLGGYLQFYFGWKAGFIFFAIIAFMGLIATLIVLPETQLKVHALNLNTIRKNIKEVTSHHLFIGISILMGLSYALMVTFNTLGPFLIQTVMNHTPVFFGHLALVLGIVFLISTFISRFLLRKYQVEQLYFIGINLFFVLAFLGFVLSYVYPKDIALITIISAAMFFSCGFIFPMSMGKGQSLFRHVSGTAAAVMYLINMIITSLAGFLVSFVHIKTSITLTLIYLILMSISLLVYYLMIKNSNTV